MFVGEEVQEKIEDYASENKLDVFVFAHTLLAMVGADRVKYSDYLEFAADYNMVSDEF